METPDITVVKNYFLALQDTLCKALETEDKQAVFCEDRWQRPNDGGFGCTRVMAGGAVFEQAAVNFSKVQGEQLPPAATLRRPELIGGRFQVAGVSIVIHPLNPYIPTTHFNIRFFSATTVQGQPVWWFGGGFDLTPYYAFLEDVKHWHQQAKEACQILGATAYPQFKRQCDHYFYLKHRQEPRGVGGLFFDDLNEAGFATTFAFAKAVGEHFLLAYLPIVRRRKSMSYGQRERDFQLYRRGRYVEFNLIYDRGTLFGLQLEGSRTESILASLPPEVTWRYNWRPAPGTPEAELYEYFLAPRDWLAEN